MEVCLTVLLLIVFPARAVTVDRVDLVELNHFYNTDDGSHVFDQVIWYDFRYSKSRYEVVDWRLLKEVRYEVTKQQKEDFRLGQGPDECPPVGRWRGGHATPELRLNPRRYVSEWNDEKSRNRRRRVIATIMQETWTIYDPEILAREIVPQSERRGLSR